MDDSHSDEDCFIMHHRGDDITSAPSIPTYTQKVFTKEQSSGFLSERRYVAYKRVWEVVLGEASEAERRVNSALSEDLNEFVNAAYGSDEDEEFGSCPVVTLPTAVVLGGKYTLDSNHVVCRLTARQCNNPMNAMKALVCGFLAKDAGEDDDEADVHVREKGQAKGGPALANYDIALLHPWYADLCARQGHKPQIVAVLSDVESFDVSVLETVFHICRNHADRLPIVFILGVTTSTGYLRQVLPLSALKCLDITTFKARRGGGGDIFSELAEKIFINPEVNDESSVVHFGVHAVEVVLQKAREHPSSLDPVLSTIQLLLLRHFSNPLTALTFEPPPKTKLPSGFNDYLHAQLARALQKETDSVVEDEDERRIDVQDAIQGDLLGVVDRLRERFQQHMRGFRVAFGLLDSLQHHLSPKHRKINLFLDFLEGGNAEQCLSRVSDKIGERSPSDLLALLAVIESHIENFPNEDSAFYGIGDLSDFIEQLQEELEKEVAQKPSGGSVSPSKRVDLSSIDAVASLSRPQQAKSRYADEVATTLVGYLRTWLKPPHTMPLAELWLIGGKSAVAVEDLLNPSAKTSLTSALIRPQGYLTCHCCDPDQNEDYSLASFPDTALSFHRYLNSGKIVNVYDWFETFAMGLEGEESFYQTKTPSSKNKKIAKARTEEGQEQRRRDLQARFLRTFHEFDYLGLLRHSGRKQDHVARTVYELLDGSEE